MTEQRLRSLLLLAALDGMHAETDFCGDHGDPTTMEEARSKLDLIVNNIMLLRGDINEVGK